MNGYYTKTIPVAIAEKLKEKGMMVDIDCDTFDEGTQYRHDEVWCNTTYAEVFDWYAEQGFYLSIHCAQTPIGIGFYPSMNHVNFRSLNTDTWEKSAIAAINRALQLI